MCVCVGVSHSLCHTVLTGRLSSSLSVVASHLPAGLLWVLGIKEEPRGQMGCGDLDDGG